MLLLGLKPFKVFPWITSQNKVHSPQHGPTVVGEHVIDGNHLSSTVGLRDRTVPWPAIASLLMKTTKIQFNSGCERLSLLRFLQRSGFFLEVTVTDFEAESFCCLGFKDFLSHKIC